MEGHMFCKHLFLLLAGGLVSLQSLSAYAESEGCLKVFGSGGSNLNGAAKDPRISPQPFDEKIASIINNKFKTLKTIRRPTYNCTTNSCIISIEYLDNGRINEVNYESNKYLYICYSKLDPCEFCNSTTKGSLFLHLVWEGGVVNYGIDYIDNKNRDYAGGFQSYSFDQTTLTERIRANTYATLIFGSE
ncbi:exported hypothetical protein [uncultured Pleomorphomonas sp.]|uniref:Uncharacterized protein n=1 Tax=uncultured Pleomorphomonas sp. TaxID=442121 RepID=A0A212LFJ2_9HYPH|nr:exported hypothetical protein [uncultured Pleomorphomonas sp.]